jgi:predicted nucleotidyltransferase component of viral defense system
MMTDKAIRERVHLYGPDSAIEQENVIKEVLQHFVLESLWRARFFYDAGFHGGTCLRILYGMNRFSEDLDFLLKLPNREYSLMPFVERIVDDLETEGIVFDVSHKAVDRSSVKKVFLKTDSIGTTIVPELPFSRPRSKRIRVKLEIDTNPPEGSDFETRYLDFPVTAAIATQTLESGFALKSHALLCRQYTKGRDWYDFLWYTSRKVVPNFRLLSNALDQQGPWAGDGVRVTAAWYATTMRRRIGEIDWKAAQRDVMNFISPDEVASVSLWSKELFIERLERFLEYLEAREEGSA